MRHRVAWLATAAASMFLLAGCGGSDLADDLAGPQTSTGKGGAGPVPAPQPGVPPEGKVGDDAGVAPGGESATGQGAADAPVAPEQQREEVKTATLTVETKTVDDAADEVTDLATELQGRVDGDTRTSGEDDDRTAILIIRVPPDALDAVLAAISDLGTETTREVHGEDVTTAKADIDARVKSLSASVDRLTALMGQSGSISDLVTLESALSQRQQELESMQAQQKALADQIGLATVTVTLLEPDAEKPDSGPTGFGDAVASGWHALLDGLGWGIAGIGYTLPVAVPVAVLAVGGWLLIRRRRRHAPAEPPA